MKRSQRLDLVARVFDGRQRDASIELGRCEKGVGDARRRLAELESYRAGYAEKMATKRDTDPRQLRELSVLVDRLDAAIAQQRACIVGAERTRDQARELWLASRRRHHAVAQACTRQASEERLQDDRREQRESDELAARRFPLA